MIGDGESILAKSLSQQFLPLWLCQHVNTLAIANLEKEALHIHLISIDKWFNWDVGLASSQLMNRHMKPHTLSVRYVAVLQHGSNQTHVHHMHLI